MTSTNTFGTMLVEGENPCPLFFIYPDLGERDENKSHRFQSTSMTQRHGICMNCGKRGLLRPITIEFEGEERTYWVCEIRKNSRGKRVGCNSLSVKEWDREGMIIRQARKARYD